MRKTKAPPLGHFGSFKDPVICARGGNQGIAIRVISVFTSLKIAYGTAGDLGRVKTPGGALLSPIAGWGSDFRTSKLSKL